MTIAADLPPSPPTVLQRRESRRAVVLAGGFGTRLAPYTSVLPKPLMPIGDRAILEIVVDQLGAAGFTDVTFSVGYLAHLIRAVFEASAARAARITYVHEDEPLGTAGPLRLLDDLLEPFIVMNGDVLTTIDYRDLVRHHEATGNVLTIATHTRRVKIDYGVLELEDTPGRCRRVEAYIEKPESHTTVSMGVYVLDPRAVEYVPKGTYFDFPDLVHALLRAGEPVGAYAHDGMWFDIGRPDDYALATTAWATQPLAPTAVTSA